MSGLCSVRNHSISQSFINICRKHRTFYRTVDYSRRQEKSLIERLHDTERCSHLFSESRRSQTVSAVLDQIFSSRNIAPDRRQTASRIFDQGTNDHVRSHITWFNLLYKFSITVVHHTDHIRLDLLDKGDQLSDLLHGIAWSCLISLGSLDRHQFRPLIDCLPDCRIIKITVFQKLHLTVCDPILCQRTF